MPIRITFGNIVLEADTVGEAAELARALDAGATPTRTRKELGNRSRAGRRPKPSLRDIFANGYRPVLELLLAGPASSEEVARALGRDVRSLPPIVRGWSFKAKAAGRPLDELLVIERVPRDEGGKPVGRYRLTDEGRRLLVSTESQVA